MVIVKYDKSGCVGCPSNLGCLGTGCPQCWETIMECDKCGEEVDELFRLDDVDLCEDCLKSSCIEITVDNCEHYITG